MNTIYKAVQMLLLALGFALLTPSVNAQVANQPCTNNGRVAISATAVMVCPAAQGNSARWTVIWPTNGTGTVTSITCNGGLTGGAITVSGICAVDGTLIAQKYSGTTAPGSIAGVLPGDLYTDTTAHNEYVCGAPAGTGAPACTSVSTGGWMLLNGGGSATVDPASIKSAVWCPAASGSGLTYTCPTANTSALTVGQRYLFHMDVTNTGNVTLNVNGTGTKAVLHKNGDQFAAGDLIANDFIDLVYDGVEFVPTWEQLSINAGRMTLTCGAAPGTPASDKVTVGCTSDQIIFVNDSGVQFQPLSVAANTAVQNGTVFYGGVANAGTDAYNCTLLPVPSGYVVGAMYHFQADVANTGAASLNCNSLGVVPLKKAVGGVTTDLSDNDIRAGQMVDAEYDGANMQVQSTLGNGPAAAATVHPYYPQLVGSLNNGTPVMLVSNPIGITSAITGGADFFPGWIELDASGSAEFNINAALLPSGFQSGLKVGLWYTAQTSVTTGGSGAPRVDIAAGCRATGSGNGVGFGTATTVNLGSGGTVVSDTNYINESGTVATGTCAAGQFLVINIHRPDTNSGAIRLSGFSFALTY